MQQETLWARVNGLREGGLTMDTQMCSSLKPVDVLLWKMFLLREKQKTESGADPLINREALLCVCEQ